MRILFHVVLGAAAGVAGGVLGPIALFYLMSLFDPEGMRQGGGGPIGILIIVTAPAGAIAGAIWGASRAIPVQEDVVRDSAFGEVDVEWRLSHVPEAERGVAVVRLLRVWVEGFESELRKHLIVLAGGGLAAVFFGWLGVFFLLLPLAGRTARFVFRARAAMRGFRRRYGEAAVAGLGELPRLLR